MKEEFVETVRNGYAFEENCITVGAAMYDKEIIADCFVKVPLKTLNRHGLVAGATGTGKTKTIQVLSEQLSAAGVPVLMMDIKGDFSGIAMPGDENSFIKKRYEQMGAMFTPDSFPVEMLTISEQNGVRMRATVSEFGPVLVSRILDLNDTQSGIMSIIFKYCDDNHLPLLDLKDLKKVLHYITNEGKEEIEKDYGRVASASTGAILRNIIQLEQQGADLFFGERSFEIDDLMRFDEKGYGYVNILRLNDIQDKPKLFSTFMLCLLAEIYNTLPEQGDADKPKLVLFIDEAHLIFSNSSKEVVEQIETTVKLIRSKGVGIYFITQNPTDVPNGVLSQLGLKIQHALRAFTAKDRKDIKTAAENFPISPFYKTDQVLTEMGIGEALVTALNNKGIPTPLVVTAMMAPQSRMNILTDAELKNIIDASALARKYNEVIDRESAYEILNNKIEQAEKEVQKEVDKEVKSSPKSSSTSRKDTDSPIGKQLVKVLTSATFIRGAFGVLNKMFRK